MAMAALVAGTLLSFGSKMSAADKAEREGKLNEQQQNLAATQREADRKGRLAKAMASSVASAGARGISAFEGSPLSIINEDIRRESVATERDRFSSNLAGITAKFRGGQQARGIRMGAASSLMQSGYSAAGSY